MLDTTPELDAETYTLRGAAQVLGIDFKTLKKRLATTNIAPAQDPTDQRARLLTRDDVRTLGLVRRRLFGGADADTSGARVLDLFKNLASRVARIEDAQLRLLTLYESVKQHVHTAETHFHVTDDTLQRLMRRADEHDRALSDLKREVRELRARLPHEVAGSVHSGY